MHLSYLHVTQSNLYVSAVETTEQSDSSDYHSASFILEFGQDSRFDQEWRMVNGPTDSPLQRPNLIIDKPLVWMWQ